MANRGRPALTRRSFLSSAALLAASGAVGGLLSGCAALDELFTGERVLTDHTGRDVTLPTPSTLSSVYFTSPLAQIFCFTMAPDLLGGTAIPFTGEQLEFLPIGTGDLPYLGSLSQGGAIDAAMLRIQKVQLIFSISGTGLTDVNVSDALSLQDRAGIPVFLIDGSFERIGDTYRLLGEALGRTERANELAGYCERIYRNVSQAVAQVPDSQRVRYYFAEGPEGLQTEPDSSQHSLAFQAAGGVNVAADVAPPLGRNDRADVTVEQVSAWNPPVIITEGRQERGGADQLIRASKAWSAIEAVKRGRVYAMPHVPFPFCDRPPGVNRFLGIQWLANLFYPDFYDVDMVETVRDFYATCYWRDVSRAQAEGILGRER